MTLRLRAHREVVDEYLAAFGSSAYGGVAGAVDYGDDGSPSPAGRASGLPEGSVPPFDVLRSANTLAMLLRVFGEKASKKRGDGLPSPQIPQTSEALRSPQTAYYESCRYTPTSPTSPRLSGCSAAVAEGSSPDGPLHCWVDSEELRLSSEALRQFCKVTGLKEGGAARLGHNPLLPPILVQAMKDRAPPSPAEIDDDLTLSNEKPARPSECEAPLAAPSQPIFMHVVSPPVAVIHQKRGLVAGQQRTERLPLTMPPPMPEPLNPTRFDDGAKPKTSAAGQKKALAAAGAKKGDASQQQQQHNTNAEGKAAEGSQQQEVVIADIQKMVAEMRNSANTMRDTLSAETRVMAETAQLLQTTADKTAAQTGKVLDVVEGGGGGGALRGGVVESALTKVLPKPVASVLLSSIGAVVEVVKTALWVLMILSITAATLGLIFMRRKATEVTIEEETTYL